MYWIHKYETSQQYGGPEEGGWWYDALSPCDEWTPLSFNDEEAAYDMCRLFNGQENKRREGLHYSYTSVLSYKEEFFCFSVEESNVPQEHLEGRPHYE